ncbi:AIPR protein [bacterium]|nr:AIPR protein [bacterium]
MDRITENLVKEFAGQYDLTSSPTDVQFEHFVNLAVVSQFYEESVNPEDVHVGGDANPGIDGLAIIVNGTIVTDVEEITDLIEVNRYLEVAFIFTQAKTSSNFNGGDIGTFIEAVRDFFRPTPHLVRGEDIALKAKLAEVVFAHSAKMRTNPTCHLYYVTTGVWNNDSNLAGRLGQGRSDIEATQQFSSVTADALGASQIQRLYRQSREDFDVEIEFMNKVTLPTLPGIQQAFIGTVPVSVLLKLICDDSGMLRRTVFEDNIRDYQGATNVNSGMQNTLENESLSQAFVVLNNGITVVSRHLQLTGNRCTLSGFQIVNGCQTSHVLFKCKDKFDSEKVLVPIKLVSTQDEEIVSAIIRSTNSQNSVKPEELEAMTEFQKKLEQYYSTYEGPGRLYYERRSKQYVSATIEKSRIVTIPIQIKAYASMFLESPHRVSGYYGTVRSRMKGQIFNSEHRPIPYYASALALYKLESLFRNQLIGMDYKPLKWYLLMLLPRKVLGKPPNSSTKQIDTYCSKLIEFLLGDVHAIKSKIEKIISLSEVGGRPEINKDTLKTQALRDQLSARVLGTGGDG